MIGRLGPPTDKPQISKEEFRRQRVEKLANKIHQATDRIYAAKCAEARLEELRPEILDLCDLLEDYFKNVRLSPVRREYVSEAAKSLPWGELGEISGLGSGHPVLTNFRRSVEGGSIPLQDNQENLRKLRDAFVKESGHKNVTMQSQSTSDRLADGFLRVGILVMVGGALGGATGAELAGEPIRAEVIKGAVAAAAAGVAEEALYPSLKRMLDQNPKLAFQRSNEKLLARLTDLSAIPPEEPDFAVAKAGVILSAQTARSAALEIRWDKMPLYEERVSRILESLKSDVEPGDLLYAASELRHLGSV